MVQKLIIVRGAVGEHLPLLAVGELAWRAYAAKWGHGYVCFTSAAQHERPPAWNKILWLGQVLQEDCAGVLWADADTLITDPNQDLAQAVPEKSAAMGWYEIPTPHYNSGVIALRNTTLVREYLEAAWALDHTRPLGWANVPGRYEQPALNHLAKAYQVTRLDPKWHTIYTIGQAGGVVTGFHGAASRLAVMQRHIAQ